MLDHVFISKTLFFPNQGILTIGDLHLGYDYMLQQAGISVPSMQTEDMIKEFKEIFTKIEKNKFKLKKVVFLGDIKHSFGFEKEEMFSFNHLFFPSCIIPKLFFSIIGEIFKTITLINNHEYP